MADSQRPRVIGIELNTGTDPAAIRQRIEMLEMVLERSFEIPGLGRKIGLDAIVGLVPVLGDIFAAVMGSYLIWEARNLGLPKWKLWRMAGNILFDTGVGAVPLVGDAFDLFFRSNTRNLRIVKRHLDKHHPATQVIEG
ncbi:MAG TPA: DUF4112 domain-containing protein [Sphingomonadaceae bacterium]|nr:DUF4112 domain-containing protein [Sphingomonadaceae bacterium]